MHSKLNRLLSILALVGVCFLGFELLYGRQVAAEHRRLAAEYCRIDIVDPRKVYFARVKTVEKMDFAWRYYLPEGHDFREYRSFFRYGGRHVAALESEPGIRFLRTRLLPVSQGMRLDRISGGGSSSGMRFKKDFADFLQQHWDEFEVSVLGDQGQVELDPSREIATLVTVAIPEHLQSEAEALIGNNQYVGESVSQLLKIEFGKDTLFEKVE